MKLTVSEAFTALLVALALAAASWFGLSKALGAHPWWAARCGMFGAAIGFAVFIPARLIGLRLRLVMLLSALAVVAACLTARYAKATFIAAPDFDAAAGTLWYAGSIASWAAFGLLVTALVVTMSRPSPENPPA